MIIYFKDLTGSVFSIDIDSDKTVRDLKQNIYEWNGTEIDNQILIYKEEVLKNEEKIIESKLSDGCSVNLLIKIVKDKFKITLEVEGRKSLEQDGNMSLEVEVLAKNTLSEVKKQIEQVCGLFADEQIWIFQGVHLENNFKIPSYDIEENSIISVVEKIVSREISFTVTSGETVKECSVKMSNERKVKDLKLLLEDKFNIPHDNQVLVLMDKYLSDGSTLHKTRIKDGDRLHIRRERLKISIKMDKMKASEVEVLSSDSLEEVKKKVTKECNIDQVTLILMYQEKRLDGNEEIWRYGVDENSAVYVFESKEISICVTLGVADGHIIRTRTERTVKDLKEEIEKIWRIKQDNQIVTYKDKTVEDVSTLHCTGMVDGDKVKVRRGKVKISIEMDQRNTSVVEVLSSQTLDEVRKKIMKGFKISPVTLILMYQEMILHGNEEIWTYGVDENSALYVFESKEIFLGITLGVTKKFLIRIMNEKTVKDLKEEIEKKLQIKHDNQIITFKDKKLEDASTLHCTGMADGDKVKVRRINMTVHVSVTANTKLDIDLPENVSIEELRSVIQQRTKLDITDHELIYQRQCCPDQYSGKECRIVHGSQINLVSISTSRILFFSALFVVFILFCKEFCPWGSRSRYR